MHCAVQSNTHNKGVRQAYCIACIRVEQSTSYLLPTSAIPPLAYPFLFWPITYHDRFLAAAHSPTWTCQSLICYVVFDIIPSKELGLRRFFCFCSTRGGIHRTVGLVKWASGLLAVQVPLLIILT